MKNTAKKNSYGNYEYLGFKIERIAEYDTQEHQDVVQWNVSKGGFCYDTCDTVKGSERLIDRIVEIRGLPLS